MSRSVRLARNFFPLLLVVTVLIPFASASGPYVIGSANTVTADPNVARPSTNALRGAAFQRRAVLRFQCGEFYLHSALRLSRPVGQGGARSGHQSERRNSIRPHCQFLAGPGEHLFRHHGRAFPNIGPSWHIENDLTDYSSIFYTAQSGQADIGNTLCCGLTSTIFASAALEFYPLAKGRNRAGSRPGVGRSPAAPSGGTVALNSTSSTALRHLHPAHERRATRIWMSTRKVSRTTNSGTPALPTTWPRNWRTAAIPASARPKSQSTGNRRAWRRSLPGFSPVASILSYGSRSPECRL